eukprot:TRINITY_DN476_c0_g1_i1.p3 TRINITY_DN476_c0_g1~~TRINITY_DN476_c0_g1_i1.p3  ORF type:complete len:340 (+),score=52.56 TRINITY_DN476_c0_g1_i1:2254-3273(+)
MIILLYTLQSPDIYPLSFVEKLVGKPEWWKSSLEQEDPDLFRSFQSHLENFRSRSTMIGSYRAGVWLFYQFCLDNELSPWPINPETVTKCLLSHPATRHARIKSGVEFLQKINNRDEWVTIIAHCSARLLDKPDYLVKRAVPIDNHLGWQMFEAHQDKLWDFKTVKFLCLFAILYGGLARFSEIANRRIEEITINKRGRIEVRIPRTKTARSGAIIVCAAIGKGMKGLPTKGLVKRLKRLHRTNEGLMFPSTSNPEKPVSNSTTNKELRSMLEPIISDEAERRNYSSHGFRRGAATKLFKGGRKLEVIMKMGRWKSAESCRLYLQLDCEIDAARVAAYE